MRKRLLPLVICFFIFSCSNKAEKVEKKEQHCEIMKYGTFDVYQKDIKVGTFYRKDSLQVETYVGKKNTGLTKVKRVFKCEYILRSNWIKQKLDTVHFTVNYTVKDNNEIQYEMSPTYLENDAKLRGKIIKVSDSIKPEILIMFGNK